MTRFGKPLHLRPLHGFTGICPHDSCACNGLHLFHELVITVEVTHDGNLCCIQAAPGFHEVAKLSLFDKPGDKRNLLPECMPVMLPAGFLRLQPGQEQIPLLRASAGKSPSGVQNSPCADFRSTAVIIEEVKAGIAEDCNG